MAAPFNRNDSTVATNLNRGWRDRQNKATNRRADDADWREVDRIRQAHFAELERKARDEAEARNAKHTAKVSCPCCDHGSVTVELAARVIRALETLPADAQLDQDVVAKLLTIAAGRQPDDPLTLHPSLNLHAPRKAESAVLAPIPQPPCLPAVEDDTSEEAAALAEIRTETVKPAKEQRKHVAPPIIDGDAT